MRPALKQLRGLLLTCTALACALPTAYAQRSSESSNNPQPTVTRRIITKVDGVVVEERDATPGSRPTRVAPPPSPDTHPGPWIYQPPPPPQPDTSSPPVEKIDLPPTAGDGDADDEPTEETTEAEDSEDEPGFLGRLFSPQSDRSPEPAGMRFTKRRGIRIRSETTTQSAPQTQEGESADGDGMSEPEPEEDLPLLPSTRLIVGEIVSVNPDNGTAVVWLVARHIVLPGDIITRNHEMEQTATLRPTTLRGGRALGMEIVSGRPRIGNEAVYATNP